MELIVINSDYSGYTLCEPKKRWDLFHPKDVQDFPSTLHNKKMEIIEMSRIFWIYDIHAYLGKLE